MNQKLDLQRLEHAFQGRPDLIGAIKQAAGMFQRRQFLSGFSHIVSRIKLPTLSLVPIPMTWTHASRTAAPNWIELFNEITRYVADLRNSTPLEPASKRRKIEDTALPINTIAIVTNGSNRPAATPPSVLVDENVLLQIKDISVVIPQRKKYTLELTPSHIRTRHPDSKELISGISYAWKEIS
jgi:hypothetical protein